MNGKRIILPSGMFTEGIFAALPETTWTSSSGFPLPIVLDRKTVLFSDAEPATHVYLVCGGLIKTYKNRGPELRDGLCFTKVPLKSAPKPACLDSFEVVNEQISVNQRVLHYDLQQSITDALGTTTLQ